MWRLSGLSMRARNKRRPLVATRYPISDVFLPFCTLLEIEPDRVLRRAGLPVDFMDQSAGPVSADVFLAVWRAARQEFRGDDFELRMISVIASGQFSAPIYAFSCAQTVALGLERLAVFKPLIGPIRLWITRDPAALSIKLGFVAPPEDVPPEFELCELMYKLECIRVFSGHHVVPLGVEVSSPVEVMPKIGAYLGQEVQVTGRTALTLSLEDADRPLVSRSPMLWDSLEPVLTEQLRAQAGPASVVTRVKTCLEESLAAGVTNSDQVARRLNMSKRSLQRRLAEEGTSFQLLLNETRSQLSQRYLADSALTVPEISHLLGFSDTSSFFRAFQGWTGKTPGAYRDEV